MFNEINEWQQQRLGKFTASEIGKLMKTGRAKGDYFGETAKTYIKTKVAEIITGEKSADINSYALEYGKANESSAFDLFDKLYPQLSAIQYGGAFPIFFPYGDFAGGSPDGRTNDGIIEIKCPYVSANHIDNLLMNTQEDLFKLNPDYYYQVQSNMIFTDTKKAYFISYDGRVIKEEQQIKVLPILYDEIICEEIKERINKGAEMMLDILTSIGFIK